MCIVHCQMILFLYLTQKCTQTQNGTYTHTSVLHVCLSPQPVAMAYTYEKLITHVMNEEPVGSRNKVTVVGVGMVGMASAMSILMKVSVGGSLTQSVKAVAVIIEEER